MTLYNNSCSICFASSLATISEEQQAEIAEKADLENTTVKKLKEEIAQLKAKNNDFQVNIEISSNMAVNFEQLIEFCIDELVEDKIVYFLHHIETTDSGKIKAKTIGKMSDNQLTVEGLFSIVLLCTCDKTGHYFITQSDGTNPLMWIFPKSGTAKYSGTVLSE